MSQGDPGHILLWLLRTANPPLPCCACFLSTTSWPCGCSCRGVRGAGAPRSQRSASTQPHPHAHSRHAHTRARAVTLNIISANSPPRLIFPHSAILFPAVLPSSPSTRCAPPPPCPPMHAHTRTRPPLSGVHRAGADGVLLGGPADALPHGVRVDGGGRPVLDGVRRGGGAAGHAGPLQRGGLRQHRASQLSGGGGPQRRHLRPGGELHGWVGGGE